MGEHGRRNMGNVKAFYNLPKYDHEHINHFKKALFVCPLENFYSTEKNQRIL